MSSVWGKLYDLEIIKNHNIRFKEDIHISEDHIFNCDYLRWVTKYFIVRKSLYNYFHRERVSLSKTYNERTYESAVNGTLIAKNFMMEQEVINLDTVLITMVMQGVRRFAFVSNDDFSYAGYKERMKKFSDIVVGVNGRTNRISHRIRLFLLKKKWYAPMYMFYYCRYKIKRANQNFWKL